ncbi:hypothetical protein QOZ80_5AG0374300 [Eleusine coracana subsp. coracana]|nr:hypothetical protein QOZ80_5AG0374300 [Eleusine coracana subsp. coracana]
MHQHLAKITRLKDSVLILCSLTLSCDTTLVRQTQKFQHLTVMSLHDNGSSDVIMRSSYSVNVLESLDDVIADEQHKKVTLLSNAAAISEMLREVELNEEKTKHAISAMNEAGNDILRKVDELKEMTTLVVEDNNKMAGEIYAEKSILATEAQELQIRLFNISEETKNFELTIEQMNHTLQRRLAASEEERAAAKKAQLEREASAQKILREQQLSLEAANQKFRWLEEQAKENAELKELLVDRGHAVDALHGEMLGIFDSITELKLKVDMELPAEELLEQVSSSLPSSAVFFKCHFSAVDELLQQDSSSLGSAIDVPQQSVSSDSLVKSASAKSGSIESASLKGDEKIVNISDDKFALDDSWDVVGDDDEVVRVPS